MKIIPNIQIKLLLLSKLLPPLCLCPDFLIERVRTEYVTIHQILADGNHSPMDLLFLVGFFLFVTKLAPAHTGHTFFPKTNEKIRLFLNSFELPVLYLYG